MIGISAAIIALILSPATNEPDLRAKAPPPPPPPFVMRHPFNILFERGSAELTPNMDEILRNTVAVLRSVDRRDHFVWVSGHADDAGSSAANLELGCRRARAIRAFLLRHDFGEDEISIMSGGDAHPISREQIGHPANRRVDVLPEPVKGYPGASNPEPLQRLDNC